MLRVGLTGSMGCGKTLVAQIFKTIGIPVYHADTRAKVILNYPSVTEKVLQSFGKDLINEHGILDRVRLAKVVFNDERKLQFLNSLIHPMVKEDFECWTTLHYASPYVIQEAAILFESGFDKFFHRIIVVTAPENLRKQRVMIRDKVTEEQVETRMKNQWTEDQKVALSDYLICNDEKQLLIPQVIQIHHQLKNLL